MCVNEIIIDDKDGLRIRHFLGRCDGATCLYTVYRVSAAILSDEHSRVNPFHHHHRAQIHQDLHRPKGGISIQTGCCVFHLSQDLDCDDEDVSLHTVEVPDENKIFEIHI
jgi:hypothetical protein